MIDVQDLIQFARSKDFIDKFGKAKVEINDCEACEYLLVLKGNMLFYFTPTAERELTGVVLMENVEINKDDAMKRIEIVATKNRYVIMLSSDDELTNWHRALINCSLGKTRELIAKLFQSKNHNYNMSSTNRCIKSRSTSRNSRSKNGGYLVQFSCKLKLESPIQMIRIVTKRLEPPQQNWQKIHSTELQQPTDGFVEWLIPFQLIDGYLRFELCTIDGLMLGCVECNHQQLLKNFLFILNLINPETVEIIGELHLQLIEKFDDSLEYSFRQYYVCPSIDYSTVVVREDLSVNRCKYSQLIPVELAKCLQKAEMQILQQLIESPISNSQQNLCRQLNLLINEYQRVIDSCPIDEFRKCSEKLAVNKQWQPINLCLQRLLINDRSLQLITFGAPTVHLSYNIDSSLNTELPIVIKFNKSLSNLLMRREVEMDELFGYGSNNTEEIIEFTLELIQLVKTSNPQQARRIVETIMPQLPESKYQLKSALLKLINDCRKQINQKLCDQLFSIDTRLRRDASLSQLLSAIILGFTTIISDNFDDPNFWYCVYSIGFCCGFESLLSPIGDERQMLLDYYYAVSDVRDLVKLKLTCDESKSISINGDRHTGLMVSMGISHDVFEWIPFELVDQSINIHPLLFTRGINADQILARWKGDTQLEQSINQQSAVKLLEIVNQWKKYLINRCDNVEFTVVDAIFDQLNDCFSPNNPILSNKDHLSSGCKGRFNDTLVLQCSSRVIRYFSTLSPSAENQLLTPFACRFTSCKSAKDRTAMSVTLEQVLFATTPEYQVINHKNDCNMSLNSDSLQISSPANSSSIVHSSCFQKLLDAMRGEEGVRLANVELNLDLPQGEGKFSFHPLQLQLMPSLYRPPIRCIQPSLSK